MSGPPMRRVKDVLLRLLPDEELESAKDIPSSGITRQYTLNLKSKRRLLLSLSPTNATRLLRHEQNVLTSEATLVSFLHEKPVPQETDPEVTPSRALSPISRPPSSSSHLSSRRSPPASLSKLDSSPTIVPLPLPSPSPQPQTQTLSAPLLPPFQTFLPTIIHHDPSPKEVGYPYSIYEPATGTPLSATKCSDEELYAVNFQLGQLVYNMATITSPNGMFGPVLKVLGDSDPSRCLSPISSPAMARLPLTAGSSSDSSRRPSQLTPLSAMGGGGSSTWDIAFKTISEAALRDGEDMSVTLPYPAIRSHISRLSHVLKTITVPRLLLFDAGDTDNILVSRTPSASSSGSLKLVGFRDWTMGVFGDPLLGSFWEDWDGSGPRRKGWGDGCKFIEKRTLYMRLMLYRCHRACVDIVREYYRPRRDSSQREMVARKRLTAVLRELDEVHVDGEVVGSPGETPPQREIGNPLSTGPQPATTEPPPTPKRTQDQALPRDVSPRKKPKMEADPSEADDEKEDTKEDDEDESSDEEEDERYQPPPAALRPNPTSLDYILNS